MKRFIIGIYLISVLYFKGSAYDGQLDASFGTAGLVSTAIDNFAVINSSVIQADGKIVVSGWSGVTKVTGINFTLARYNSNGTLDSSFGNAGVVITTFPGTDNQINSMMLQPDGKIVVGGVTNVGGYRSFVLARYNTNGFLDATFGNAGIAVTNVGISAGIVSIALQSDGKMVALGQNFAGTSLMVVARYYSDGTLDNGSQGGTGFGSNGIVLLNINPHDQSASIAVQENGKIVIGGSTGLPGSRDFMVARLTSTGVLDPSFGTGGSVITSFALDAQVNDLKIQKDGKIILVGFTGAPNSLDFALVRYNSDGSLDASFGSGGIVTTDLGGNDQIFEVILQPDGKLIVGGTSNVSGINQFVLTRYTAHGLVDLTFNPSSSTPGTVFTSFIGDNSELFALALQQNGRVVASGNVLTGLTTSEFGLARYLNNNPLQFTQITSPTDYMLFSSPLLTVSGAAQNPSNIGVFADGVLIGSTMTSGSTNNWSVKTTLPLSAGAYVISAIAAYKDGNVNLASSNPITIVVNDCRSALSLGIASKYCAATLS